MLIFLQNHQNSFKKNLEELSIANEKMGVPFKHTKTNIQTNSTKCCKPIDNQELQYIDETVYLEQLLLFKKKIEKEIQ